MKVKVTLGILFVVLLYTVHLYFTKPEVNNFITNTGMKRVNVDNCVSLDYEQIDENIIECSLECFSFIVQNMINDGYSISTENCLDSAIDIILMNDLSVIRLRYTKDGTLTSIAKPYEESSTFITYINEEYIMN